MFMIFKKNGITKIVMQTLIIKLFLNFNQFCVLGMDNDNINKKYLVYLN